MKQKKVFKAFGWFLRTGCASEIDTSLVFILALNEARVYAEERTELVPTTSTTNRRSNSH